MVPDFLAAWVHIFRDLAARSALATRHPDVAFELGPPLGPDPLLELLVAERTRQTDPARAGAPRALLE